MACLVADGFLDVAGRFFGTLPKDLNDATRVAYERRGDLAAAATALALAIELYLKAVAARSGKRINHTHDLHKLFHQLPPDIAAYVERSYAAACASMAADATCAFDMFITTSPVPPTPDEMRLLQKRRRGSDTVRDLLRSERDAFQNWRYVYEADLPSGISLIQVEYQRLGIVARILRDGVLGGARA